MHAFARIDVASRAWPDIELSGRLKNTGTIIEKLKREKTALGKMQDIAGLRVVLGQGGRAEQDQIVHDLLRRPWLAEAESIDRRSDPRFGYRAVHVVGRVDDHLLEIQVRTMLQHRWAAVYERLADEWGRGMRYGEPPPEKSLRIGGASVSAREVDRYMMELSDYIDDLERIQLASEAQETADAAAADELPVHELESRRNRVFRERLQNDRDAKSLVASLREVLSAATATGDSAVPPDLDIPRIEPNSLQLFVYDRGRGRLILHRSGASEELLEHWRELDEQYRHEHGIEIVVLKSTSAKSLGITHGRYVVSAEDLTGDPVDPTEQSSAED